MEIIKIELKPSNISTIECVRNIKLGGDNAITVRDYSDGATPPRTEYGNLKTVKIPLKPTNDDCAMVVEVPLETGCPPDTIDMTWDSDLSPSTITPNTSEYIYVKDGYGPFVWEIVSGYGFTLSVSRTAGTQNTLFASSAACGTAKIKVVDTCQTETTGSVAGGTSGLEWDYDNSGQTVSGSNSVNVFVLGGSPPYTWSVSGTGFTLHTKQSYSVQNTLYADGSACGTATITVTDLCDVKVTGYVRCTSLGEWVVTEDTDDGDTACGIMSGQGYDSRVSGTQSAVQWTKSSGRYKLVEELARTAYHTYPQCCTYCDSLCDTYVSDGCSPCLIQSMTCAETSMVEGCSSPPYVDPGCPDDAAASWPCCFCGGGSGNNCYAVYRRRLWGWECP